MAAEQKKKIRWSSAWEEARELIWAQRKRLLLGAVLMIINQAMGLVLPASTKYLVDVVSYAQVRGMPLGAAELAEVIGNLVEETAGIDDDARHLGLDAANLKHGEQLEQTEGAR